MEVIEIFQHLASVVLIDRRSSVSGDRNLAKASIPLTRTIHGAEVGAGTVTPLVGFYFGAKWCPPCRAFSPVLSEFAKNNASNFSVIYVSVDHSAKDCEEFTKGKSFLSIPYETGIRQVLLEKFGVKMFPTLIVCDTRTGKVVTRWGRLAVQNERNPGQVVASWLVGSNGVTLVHPIHMLILVMVTFAMCWYFDLLF
mmetsp:Transcript_13474/g.15367  ORF Transcript_13474/g.15367 Transcript_13474/m.15367 type:complete len:197 (-) Transcript_13474:1150-1740(-)